MLLIAGSNSYLQTIQQKRIQIWERYASGLKVLADKGYISLPVIPAYATNNAHLFYILTKDKKTRSDLISYLLKENIHAVFHYQSLHRSAFYSKLHDGRELPNCDMYADQLLRLPLFFDLSENLQTIVIDKILNFFDKYYST